MSGVRGLAELSAVLVVAGLAYLALLAQVVRSRRLAEDLRSSRGAAVTAIEEERRRIRGDLHDGLGPRLSGIAFAADAVRNSLRADPDRATELLVGLRQEIATAIEDIRRLVYGMRPPALDELGLVPALRQQAQALRTLDGDQVQVVVAADGVPTLPAAVEVAAYRIVVEALSNVARHSGSRQATVRLALAAGALRIEVADGGRSAGEWRPGVGMTSMRERAAALGGTVVGSGTPRGGRVVAVLPLTG